MNFQVVYNEKQVADPGKHEFGGLVSPSASKPKDIAKALSRKYEDLVFVEPDKLEISDFYKCHHRDYVDGIFAKTRLNGFGTISDSVNSSLPYTSGAMFKACKIATPTKPACALVSGFHHAGYFGFERFGLFCTFNGLVLSAMKMIEETKVKRVAILDCDMHHGNGTDDIISKIGGLEDVLINFSRSYFGLITGVNREELAKNYIGMLHSEKAGCIDILEYFKPDLIIYQSGADVHIDDPSGGLLTEDEMIERDVQVFQIAKKLDIPIAWCLAGGYQIDPYGSIGTLVRLHLNTFYACEQVFGKGENP